MNPPRILIVDDDSEVRTLLADHLVRHGFKVEAAVDGRGVRRILDDGPVDLIVLDVMLPGDDGFSLCRELRANSRVPIIMLTALAGEADRVVGLEFGADDYVVKPFSARELVARIKAVLRRTESQRLSDSPAGTLTFAGWSIDAGRREVRTPDGVLLPLTAGEFDLLAAFAEHPQRVLTREHLLELTRGRSAGPFDRSIDVQLSRLRRKIEEDPNEPTLIKTVRGGGYLFMPTVVRVV